MSIATDFHNHIVRSSAQQMVEAARSKGIRILGLSEHVFQMREARPHLLHMPLEGPILAYADYVEEVQAAGKNRDVEVRLGLEVDFIPEQNEVIQSTLQGLPWDFLIGSVHEVDGVLFESLHDLERAEGERLWSRYYTLLRAAVRSGYFSVVSHPVRMRSTNPYLPANLDEELEQLAADAAEYDVALEVNGYDTLTYINLVRRLVRACANHHTAISVGSDAHNPTQVTQAHHYIEPLLREAGITSIRTWRQRVPEEMAF